MRWLFVLVLVALAGAALPAAPHGQGLACEAVKYPTAKYPTTRYPRANYPGR